MTEEQLKQNMERHEQVKQYLEIGSRYAEQNQWSVSDVPKEFDSIVRVDMFIQNLTKALEQLYTEGREYEMIEWIISHLIVTTNKDLCNPLLKANESVNKYQLESLKGLKGLFRVSQANTNASINVEPISETMRNSITSFFSVIKKEEHTITAAEIEQFRPYYPDCKEGDIYSPTTLDIARCTEADLNLLYQRHWRTYASDFEYATESTFLNKDVAKAEKLFAVLNARGDDNYWARQYLELSRSYWQWLKKKELNEPEGEEQPPVKNSKLTAPAIHLFCGMVAESGIMAQEERIASVYCQNVCEKYGLRYSDKVRQHFTATPSFKKDNKDLKKVIMEILPALPEHEKSNIEGYIRNKTEQPAKKLYG